MKLKDLNINLDQIAVLIIVLISLLYYNVVFNSPIIFGDEGHYAAMARGIIKTMMLPKEFLLTIETYHDPFTSKPLFYIFESFAWLILGEFGLKIIIPIFSALGALMIYLFMKDFENPKAGIAASFIFLMIPSLITYGVLGYVDALLCLLIISSIYFMFKALNNEKKYFLVLSGIFAGFALLTKITSVIFLFLFMILYFILFERKKWKYLLAILLISFFVIVPWHFIRNPILFGDICYQYLPQGAGCSAYNDIETPKIDGLEYTGRNPGSGTEASIMQIGLLNYFRFAFGWAIPIIFLFGLSMVVTRKAKLDMLLILWFLLQIVFLVYLGTRSEDTARYMLPMVISISMISGIFMSSIFDRLKKYHVAIAFVFILIIAYPTWIFGQEKLDTMMQVKQFIPGVFDACKWAKDNTPSDSIFLATYGQHVSYQCDRKMAALSDPESVFLSNNDTSYESLKINKVNYIYIIEGLITSQPYMENYPLAFVQYIESSKKFKLAYDNRQMFDRAGVRIYEVLY